MYTDVGQHLTTHLMLISHILSTAMYNIFTQSSLATILFITLEYYNTMYSIPACMYTVPLALFLSFLAISPRGGFTMHCSLLVWHSSTFWRDTRRMRQSFTWTAPPPSHNSQLSSHTRTHPHRPPHMRHTLTPPQHTNQTLTITQMLRTQLRMALTRK